MAHRPARHEAANALEVTPERSLDSTRTGPRALSLGLEPQAGLHDEGLERVIDDLAATVSARCYFVATTILAAHRRCISNWGGQ